MNKKITTISVLFFVFALIGCSFSEEYEVRFETNGGTSVSNIIVEAGSVIEAPQTSKEGHTLDGWYTSINQGITLDERWFFLNNTVTHDITLYAKWEVNQYTIIFDSAGGSSVDNLTKDFGADLTKPITEKEGHTLLGWYLDDEYTKPYDFTTMQAEDIELVARWEINDYTISFDSQGGSEVDTITQTFDSNIVVPENPTKEGHTFKGWDPDIPELMPSQDITVVAQWEVNQYTITFDSAGGSSVDNLTQDFGADLTKPITEKEGHTLLGWYLDDEHTKPYDFTTTMPAEDINLVARWEINEYTVTYKIMPTILSVSLSGSVSSVLTSNGSLFMWGTNSFGELGDGTTVDSHYLIDISDNFQLLEDEMIVKVSTGGYHSSALTSFGRLFTWGLNSSGQLGVGSLTNRYLPVDITTQFNLDEGENLVDVALGTGFSSALTSAGRIFVWGSNGSGQLGNGTLDNALKPIDITENFNLEHEERIVKVSLNYFHIASLTSKGRIFTWGGNNSGQLGNGSYADELFPNDITNQFNLSEDDRIIDISIGVFHSTALTLKGRVFTWGRNSSGQLGDGTLNTRLIPTDITSFFNLSHSDKVIGIDSRGYSHSSAYTLNGHLFLWGFNEDGRIGNGNQIDQSTPFDITEFIGLNYNERIINSNLGSGHSSATTSEGRLFMWGRNSKGQLGDGTIIEKLKPTSTQLSLDFEIISTETYSFQDDISLLEPYLLGHSFHGWYHDDEMTTLMILSEMPAQNIALYGKWIIE